jgi:hypothetical protein
MPRKRIPDRHFTLTDLMVLIAATCAGLVILRPYLATFANPNWQQASPHIRTIEATYGAWSSFAACWMIALLFLRYRRPHPRRGRLVRRPGHVACCVAAVALVEGFLYQLAIFGFSDPIRRPFSFQQFWITVSGHIGPTVAGAWLLLALSGRWRADPGWIDRLGRLLGCCWIGWMLFWLLPNSIRMKIPPFWDGVLL